MEVPDIDVKTSHKLVCGQPGRAADECDILPIRGDDGKIAEPVRRQPVAHVRAHERVASCLSVPEINGRLGTADVGHKCDEPSVRGHVQVVDAREIQRRNIGVRVDNVRCAGLQVLAKHNAASGGVSRTGLECDKLAVIADAEVAGCGIRGAHHRLKDGSGIGPGPDGNTPRSRTYISLTVGSSPIEALP